MATTVKFLHSGMTGAPVLSGQAGSLLTLLDACLVNGFGAVTMDSVTITSGIATMNRAAGHPFEVGAIATIAGATVSGGSINGEREILTSTINTVTFDATGIANQTATGTITAKLSPLGWTKEFTGTNLGVYKSPNVVATGFRLRLDDTGTTSGRVVGYEVMTDVNTGTKRFPTEVQQSGGLFWPKSPTADSTARVWTLVGNDKTFYLYTGGLQSGNSATWGFGDFNSLKSPDAFNCFICGSTATLTGVTVTSIEITVALSGSTATAGFFLARGVTGLGGSYNAVRNSPIPYSIGAYGGSWSGADVGNIAGSSTTSHFTYPNPADNGLYLTELTIGEGLGAFVYRGQLPGLYFCPQRIGTGVFAHRDSVVGVSGLSGRTVRAIVNQVGPAFVDVTGPW